MHTEPSRKETKMIVTDTREIEKELRRFHRNGCSFPDASDLLESIFQLTDGNIRRALDLYAYEKAGRAYVVPYELGTPIWQVTWNNDRGPTDDDYWEISAPEPFSIDMLDARGNLRSGYCASRSEAEVERMQRYITTVQSHTPIE